MPYKAKKPTAIDTSSPDALANSLVSFSKYVERELIEVASAAQFTEQGPVLYSAPPKPRQGTEVYADGSHWNPGSGQGPYWFDGTSWHSGGPGLASIAMLGSYLGSYLRSYLAGLTLSTAGSSATFSVAAGVAADSTSAAIIALASSMSKTTGSWAAGSGNGGLDAGAIAANTWYHVYVISQALGASPDVTFSLSASAPTLHGGNTLFRRIGSMKTNASSQWILFHQVGDEFYWDTAPGDFNAVPGAKALYTFSVPPGLQVNVFGMAIVTGATAQTQAQISAPEITSGFVSVIVPASGQYATVTYNLRTNTSGQLYVFGNGPTLTMTTLGWIDRRGRDA